MCHHTHLTLEEREDIMCLKRQGKSMSAIAAVIGRNKSTISRELSRNMSAKDTQHEYYRASTAQRRYEKRRERCRRSRLLDNREILNIVGAKFLEQQWSPEQIEGRLRYECGPKISDSTIYRGIARGVFDKFIGGHKASRKLRRRGKKRKDRLNERRGKIIVSHEISERPQAVEERSRLGDWEGDTVICGTGGACLVTLVDRKSGLLVGGKSSYKRAEPVSKVITRKLKTQPHHSVTLDRGKEFAAHASVTEALGVEIYFALPHHPWQRGSNENTNGLLREYFPKGCSLKNVSAKEIQMVYDKLNRRPRKRLGYKTPYEVHYATALQLI